MNRIIVIFIVFCALAVPSAQAESKEKTEKPVPEVEELTIESFTKTFMKQMTDQLKIDRAQTKKIRAAITQSYEKSKDKWDRQDKLEEELEQVGKDLGNEIRAMYEDIRVVLTHAQREQFDDMRVHQRAQGNPRNAMSCVGRGNGGGSARMPNMGNPPG